GSKEAPRALHRRTAGGLPRLGAGPREPVSHAHRAAADRRTRRGQAARRGGPLRPPILLLQLAAGAAAGEPGARQGPAPLPQPVADLGRMRAIASRGIAGYAGTRSTS